MVHKDPENVERIKYNNGVDSIAGAIREHLTTFEGFLDVIEVGMGCLSTLATVCFVLFFMFILFFFILDWFLVLIFFFRTLPLLSLSSRG